jgi:asparagine synthase (glutamine-hydrolysing)
MCGICGIFYTNNEKPVDDNLIKAMCKVIAHRGPDDQGTYVKDSVGLGSQRLSIIDLDSGKQPIHNEDETVWIVFNGEIYNYLDLTRLLANRGHKFYTKSDTEAIVHAYEEFGDEFVQHLNGMFAFALWDGRRQRLLLARDRTGIKPLYYAQFNGALLFGSELKTILAYPGFPRSVDLTSLNEYLSFEYVPTPRSIFQGIAKLPPGHFLSYENGQLHLTQYWDMHLERSETSASKDLYSVQEELLEILRDSVRKEMISDVPIGVLLSGGIDSSAVAALMCEAAPGKVKSFSISFDDPSFDESRYARLVAHHLGTEHSELTLTPSIMLDLIPHLAEFMDEPLGDSSFVPTFLLSQFTHQYVKVALGGDGGDELFAGYSTLQSHRLVQYYEHLLPGFVRWKIIPCFANQLPVSFNNISFDFKVKRFISGRGIPYIVRHHIWLGSFSANEKKQLLQPWLLVNEKNTYDIAFQHQRNNRAENLINQILYCDFKLYLEGDILTKVDRASMANSLEVRVPLLNHTLVEYVVNLPVDLKLHGLTTKYILKRVMRNRLPAAILRRGKKGFNMPVAKWLTGALRPLTEDLFAPEHLKQQGLFEAGYIHSLLDEHLAQRRDNRKLLWTLLVFQLWYESWMK